MGRPHYTENRPRHRLPFVRNSHQVWPLGEFFILVHIREYIRKKDEGREAQQSRWQEVSVKTIGPKIDIVLNPLYSWTD